MTTYKLLSRVDVALREMLPESGSINDSTDACCMLHEPVLIHQAMPVTSLKYDNDYNTFQHRLGACKDSLCLPDRSVLGVRLRMSKCLDLINWPCKK